MSTSVHTSQVPAALQLLERGDSQARGRLVTYVADRLQKLAHDLLRSNPVRRWENSDDLLQLALVRLHRSLERARPVDARALLELAALEMRHALIDLARHYFGPLGMGAHHRSYPPDQAIDQGHFEPHGRASLGPEEFIHRAESLQQLYIAIGTLPDEEREVIDLLWIHELSQAEAATILGVAIKTVGRRWRRARLRLADALREVPAEV